MTNAEAIETLRANYPDACFEQLRCAVDMAIKALEKPERKKGHWIKGKMWSEGIGIGETYGFYYACSECNSSVQGGYDVCGKNFCEKCGADNREDGSANADVES